MGIQARTKHQPSTGQLTKEQTEALAHLIDGQLDAMSFGNESYDYIFWIDLLRDVGANKNATRWEESLRNEGLI